MPPDSHRPHRLLLRPPSRMTRCHTMPEWLHYGCPNSNLLYCCPLVFHLGQGNFPWWMSCTSWSFKLSIWVVFYLPLWLVQIIMFGWLHPHFGWSNPYTLCLNHNFCWLNPRSQYLQRSSGYPAHCLSRLGTAMKKGNFEPPNICGFHQQE